MAAFRGVHHRRGSRARPVPDLRAAAGRGSGRLVPSVGAVAGHALGRRPAHRHPSRAVHGRGRLLAAGPHAGRQRADARRRGPAADPGDDRPLDAAAGRRGRRRPTSSCRWPSGIWRRSSRARPRGADERVLRAGLGAGAGRGDGPGRADADTLRRWFGDLAAGGSNFENDPEKQRLGDEASADVDDACAGPRPAGGGARRQRAVADAARGAAGRPPDRAEVLANLKLILLGGMQEPGHALGITLWALLRTPTRWRRCARPGAAARRGRGGAALALAGRHPDAAGDRGHRGGAASPWSAGTLAAVLSSANRDDRHWQRPDGSTSTAAARMPASAWARTTAPARRWRGTRCACRWSCCWSGCPACGSTDHEVELRGWEFRAPTALHVRWD